MQMPISMEMMVTQTSAVVAGFWTPYPAVQRLTQPPNQHVLRLIYQDKSTENLLVIQGVG